MPTLAVPPQVSTKLIQCGWRVEGYIFWNVTVLGTSDPSYTALTILYVQTSTNGAFQDSCRLHV